MGKKQQKKQQQKKILKNWKGYFMKKIDFEKLTKEKTPRDIIAMHTKSIIYLTDRQIEKVIELRGKDYWNWKIKKEGN